MNQRIRLTVVAAAALAAVWAPASAYADGTGIPDYGSAQQTLRSGQVHDTVSKFLVAAQHAAAPAAADGGSVGAPRVGPNVAGGAPGFDLKDPVALYELNPDFVTGKAQPSAQNALKLSYLASRVSASNGHQAAVLLSHQPKGTNWQLAGIRDGDSDLKLAEQGTAQDRTFSEPQIHAWYKLTAGGTVEPLNQEAVTGLGGKHSVTLAAYQKLVTGRYGNKQPGSGYDSKGLAGGYGLVQGQAQGQGQEQEQPLAAATVAQSSPMSWWPGAAAALAAVGGGALLLRRRAARR